MIERLYPAFAARSHHMWSFFGPVLTSRIPGSNSDHLLYEHVSRAALWEI